jgi:hypothetical protein
MVRLLLGLLALAWDGAAAAQTDYAAQVREGDAVLRGFRFASGERMAELRIHYATLGTPRRDTAGRIVNAVMVLHGTGGSGKQFLQPQFAASCTGPASRSTSAATTSSCPTASATANRRSRATASGCASRNTIMPTWSRRSGGCWSRGSA